MEATFSYFPYSYFADPIQDLICTTNLEPTCMAPNDRSSCSSMAAMCSPMLHHESPAHAKKRNMAISSQGSTTASASLTSPQHKDGTAGSKRKKQKRSSSITEEDKKKKAGGHGGVKGKEACGEPPAGYIHVRARRGHATDSHSLAERVRREKISERMRMLQSLVPGCDKVTGKALMLNEIINYVQSLQIQVEFLSMKLASMNPMSYEFGVLNIDSYPRFPELARVAHMPHESLQTTTEQQPSFDGATSTATMDYQVAMSTEAAPHLSVLYDPTAFAQILQGGSSPMVQVVGQGQCNLHDKVEYFNTMYSFQ